MPDLDTSALSGASVLVTGGAGFIGSHLVEGLVAAGASVTVLDNFSTGCQENLQAVREATQLWPVDLAEPKTAQLIATRNFAYVFHLASNAYVPSSTADPAGDLTVNVLATLRLIEGLRGKQSKVVFASSAAVYGNPTTLPIVEDQPPTPISPYGISKLAAERYLKVYHMVEGLQVCFLRLFSVYGPRQRKQVIYDLIVRLQQEPPRLWMWGDGTQVRDFVCVTDAVQALLLAVLRAPMCGEVHNVASGRSITTGELALLIARTMGLSPALEFSGNLRPGDTQSWVADISRIGALGYSPTVPLEDGLKGCVDWVRWAHG